MSQQDTLLGPRDGFSGGVIQIDRSKPFDAVAFIGNGWSIVEQDESSLNLAEVDLNKVCLATMLEEGETQIIGEENLRRLKMSCHIRLDAKVFQILWENRELILESWKEKVNGLDIFIFFDGTVIRSPDGRRCVLFMCFVGGQLLRDCDWLLRRRDASGLSATLAL